MSLHSWRYRFIAALWAALALPALAQEAIHTDAAVQPAPGHFLWRQQLTYRNLGREESDLDRQVEEWESLTRLTYGVTPTFSLRLDVPLIYRQTTYGDHTDDAGGDDGSHGGGGHGGLPPPLPTDGEIGHTGSAHEFDFGLADIQLVGKLRVWQHDTGPIDTARLALLAGVELPTGEDAFSSDSLDPIIGAALTVVRGRHGFGASAKWKFNTGDHGDPLHGGDHGSPDELEADAAYLFRFYPAAYRPETPGAAYFVLEANGTYDTIGDHELLIAPGLMWEGKNVALELSLQLPALQEVEHRPKTEFTVAFGFRVLF